MKKELIKEKIAWYKLLFTILATAQIGSISWFVSNYDKAIKLFVLLDSLAIVAIFIGLSISFAIPTTKMVFRLREASSV